jgi:hypothetical protein
MANYDFDFQAFAVQALKTVDSIRSTGREGAGVCESRINAFYRAIGLPSIKGPDSKIDKTNTANEADPGQLLQVSQGLLTIREQSYTKNGTEEEYVQELHHKRALVSDNLTKRTRGWMLPFVVNGEVEILPKIKRVGAVFAADEDLEVGDGKGKYQRPMLEAIISMRLKGIGAVDNNYKKTVESEFSAAFPGAQIDLTDQNHLNVVVATMLRKCIQSAVNKFNEAVKVAGDALTAASGEIYVTPVDGAPEQNPEAFSNIAAPTTVDKQESKQQEKDKTKKAFMTMFEFEDIDGGSKRSVKESLLSSELLNLVAATESRPQATNKQKKDAENNSRKIDKGTVKIKIALSTMDMFTGTFSSLSGLDILIIITALFEVELKYLYGLLNADGKSSLSKAKPDIWVDVDHAPTISESYEALKVKVTELYEFADKALTETTKSTKKHKQST